MLVTFEIRVRSGKLLNSKINSTIVRMLEDISKIYIPRSTRTKEILFFLPFARSSQITTKLACELMSKSVGYLNHVDTSINLKDFWKTLMPKGFFHLARNVRKGLSWTDIESAVTRMG